MQHIMAGSTIEEVIASTTLEGVIAIATSQCIIQGTPIKKVVSIKPLDSIRHIVVPPKRIIACCRTSDNDTIPQLLVTPADVVRKLKSFNSEGCGQEVVLHTELPAS